MATRWDDLETIRYLVSIGCVYEKCGLPKLLGLKKLPESRELLLDVINIELVNRS